VLIWGCGQTYSYDAENRLLQIKNSSGGVISNLYYWGDGNLRAVSGERPYYDPGSGSGAGLTSRLQNMTLPILSTRRRWLLYW
jgi:hypothetical protein